MLSEVEPGRTPRTDSGGRAGLPVSRRWRVVLFATAATTRGVYRVPVSRSHGLIIFPYSHVDLFLLCDSLQILKSQERQSRHVGRDRDLSRWADQNRTN